MLTLEINRLKKKLLDAPFQDGNETMLYEVMCNGFIPQVYLVYMHACRFMLRPFYTFSPLFFRVYIIHYSLSIMPGHKEKFQSPLKREDITCPKCSYVLKVPIKARCGHTFCKDCVTDLCPLDGEEIIIQQEELIQLRDKISNLVVTCYEPCFWIGLLKESKVSCQYYSML